MKNETTNTTYFEAIRLKVAEMRNDNFRLEHLISVKRLETRKLEGELGAIHESTMFWLWQLYCKIRQIFHKNGKRKD